ncbi:MAG TPA: hydrolase [Desulfosalsimonadaceae bacterium]|nr:hydrolase [Desulfosalsimonadaceae bacterium]
MLHQKETALLVIDVQGKLAETVHEAERIRANLQKLIQGARLFDLPMVVTEQNPKGLGPTIPELQPMLEGAAFVSKTAFNACLHSQFVEEVRKTGCRQMLVAGIETHICIYQTVAALLEESLEVHVAADAVSSRTVWDRTTALERMRDMGALIETTEMALFELMKKAEGDNFKQFVRIVK